LNSWKHTAHIKHLNFSLSLYVLLLDVTKCVTSSSGGVRLENLTHPLSISHSLMGGGFDNINVVAAAFKADDKSWLNVL